MNKPSGFFHLDTCYEVLILFAKYSCICLIASISIYPMNSPAVKSRFDFLGRLCLATTFAVAIPTKILNFSSVVNSISQKGIPSPIATILLVGAISCLFGGVGFLLFGNDQKIGASLLLIFLVPTTLIMHFFPFQSLAVFMNLGLIGGLIMLLTRVSPSDSNWSLVWFSGFSNPKLGPTKLDIN